MDTLLDGGGSPRRGSLNSLHRQSSGSFSHSSRPAVSLQANNNNNLSNLYKDLDKFTRYFIIKTVQVIVQSRTGGGSKRTKTECKPTGNDWFNINITDIAEVSERTKAALDSEGLSIRTNWRVCCEISLKTNDGGRVVLEHWIISNKSNLNSSQNYLSSKLNNNQAASKSQNRTGHLSTSNNSTGPLSTINSSSTARVSPFSTKMRSRLNSIDDCCGDNFSANKLLVGGNNENYDIKSSTSCFSLATTPANHSLDQTATTTMTASPSATSLSNNQAQSHPTTTTNNNSSSHQPSTKTNSMSSIYTIYNRMSLLLKTLMTTTHIVPAYRLASRTSQTDSCVICYRVYTSPASYQKPNPTSAKGSVEDVSCNLNSESPNRRSSSSNSSFGSINIKEFVSTEELDHFCPILKLGSVKTDVNELEVSLCYRTDVKNSNHLMRSPRLRDNMYNKIMDEECLTAAKQLLAGNDCSNRDQHHSDSDSITNGTNGQELYKKDALNYIDQPLRPAFAAKDQKTEINLQDPNLVIVESAFDGLLQINKSHQEDLLNTDANLNGRPQKVSNQDSNQQQISTHAQSEPIQVPIGSQRFKNVELGQNLSSDSTPKSLTDSFVFVDLNPPFASEEQNDLNSFFHGPSPAFSNGFDSLKDVDELTNQLAVIEANASQLDEFVDNICASEEEEEQ